MQFLLLLATLVACTLAQPSRPVYRRQMPPPPGSIANDLVMGACRANTLIFTRGTTEPGNMGIIVGPKLQAQMTQALGGANNVAVQGVNYNASVDGAITGFVMPNRGEGAINMAKIATQTLATCPNTKMVLAGYSQGAEQVRGALANMGAQASKMSAVITFGDPLQNQSFPNVDAAKTRVFCNQGDGVCTGRFAISAAHLSYGMTSIAPAVEFIMAAMGNTAAEPAAATFGPAAGASPTTASAKSNPKELKSEGAVSGGRLAMPLYILGAVLVHGMVELFW